MLVCQRIVHLLLVSWAVVALIWLPSSSCSPPVRRQWPGVPPTTLIPRPPRPVPVTEAPVVSHSPTGNVPITSPTSIARQPTSAPTPPPPTNDPTSTSVLLVHSSSSIAPDPTAVPVISIPSPSPVLSPTVQPTNAPLESTAPRPSPTSVPEAEPSTSPVSQISAEGNETAEGLLKPILISVISVIVILMSGMVCTAMWHKSRAKKRNRANFNRF